jgi:hypothetical protein
MSDPKPWYEPDELFGPGPSALVAFVLAVLVLMGNSLMVNATVTLFARSWDGTSDWTFVWATLAGLVIPALVSAFLARRAVTSPTAAAWELVVARTALVLAVIGVAYALVLALGQVIQLA